MTKTQEEIKLERIELIESFFTFPKLQEQAEIEFNHSVNVQYNLEDQKIGTLVEVQTSSNQIEGLSARLKVSIIFSVSIMGNIEEGSIPKDLASTLNRIILGTIRGIMFNLYRGTALHNAILPIIPDVEVTS